MFSNINEVLLESSTFQNWKFLKLELLFTSRRAQRVSSPGQGRTVSRGTSSFFRFRRAYMYLSNFSSRASFVLKLLSALLRFKSALGCKQNLQKWNKTKRAKKWVRIKTTKIRGPLAWPLLWCDKAGDCHKVCTSVVGLGRKKKKTKTYVKSERLLTNLSCCDLVNYVQHRFLGKLSIKI